MKLKEKIYNILLILVLGGLMPAVAFGQNSNKRGGIGFRIDENPPVNKIHSYDSVFSIFGQKYSFAVTSYVLPLVPSYTDTLKSLAQRGIELMDNTPTHSTQFFNVLNLSELNQYINNPGVDHFNGQKVCLKYVSCDTANPHGEGYVNVFQNKVISYEPGEFHDLLSPSPYFAVYLDVPVNPLCLFYDIQAVNRSDPDTLYIKSFWDETISLTANWHIHYHKIQNNEVVMHDTAVKILGQRSLHVFDSVNLARPYTWIQPEGPYPWINPVKLKSILGDKLNYKQSTSFITPSWFCYNEYNPQKIKQFAINSEVLNMETGTFTSTIHVIAKAIAKHYVLFDVARLANPTGGFNAYLQRMDSLLSWCTSNNIPIRTYSQWKSILYDSIPQKITNIFPQLNVDLDQDNWPDGFNYGLGGVFDQTDGVEESGNKCFRLDSLSGNNKICFVDSLAGLEKGKNLFSIWTKGLGKPGSRILCHIRFQNQLQDIYIPSDSSGWKQYTYVIYVPASTSIADFEFYGNIPDNHDIVKISGMNFRSAGFLTSTPIPLQVETANVLFPKINLNNLVLDTTYPPSSLIWTFKHNHHMRFSKDSLGMMKSSRPTSFWLGKDSVYAIARRPDMLTDSCFFRFRSDSVPSGCTGESINIAILDTITSLDYVVWTSSPYDSTMSDTTIFNPTVSPKITTHYYVKVYNLLGNIFHDSIVISRYPYPVPGLFKDSTICFGDSVVLTAHQGNHYLWSTGDSTATITVRPDTTTVYTVHVTNQGHCSADDTCTISVDKIPDVKISGLLTHYCANDTCILMQGTPWYGHFGGSPGIVGSQFCPKQARIGRDTVWYAVTTTHGCYKADTVFVNVNASPEPGLFKDSTICEGKSVILTAKGGTSYLWSTMDTTASITVSPGKDSVYSVKVTNQWDCSAGDTTTIFVEKIPVVKIQGLLPQYCAIDTCYGMHGTPGNGLFGGSPGVVDSTFCPKLAGPGRDTVWYQVTTQHGCYNADTAHVVVNLLPVIPKLPDTTLYADKTILLDAGPGADNYLWSNGDTTYYTSADTLHHGLGLLEVWVYVTKEGCVATDTARIIFIKNPIGINDIASEDLFKIFPVPFNESINIVMKENPATGDQARLTDMKGEIIASVQMVERITKLPVTNIAKGVYILLLRHNNREYYVKVVRL